MNKESLVDRVIRLAVVPVLQKLGDVSTANAQRPSVLVPGGKLAVGVELIEGTIWVRGEIVTGQQTQDGIFGHIKNGWRDRDFPAAARWADAQIEWHIGDYLDEEVKRLNLSKLQE